MKIKALLPVILFLVSLQLHGQQDTTQQHFSKALEELTSMLSGTQPLDFERAVFITENAYRDNAIRYEDYQAALGIHSSIIGQLIKANTKDDWKQYRKVTMGFPMETEEQTQENYRKALANWAIFTYLTDTVMLNSRQSAVGQWAVAPDSVAFPHLPFTYSNEDPFGTSDWKNSQVLNLLENQRGNCYALATLFKIFSERFQSGANLATAPQHVYIQHHDPKGDLYNVELATRSFPGSGSLQTLTYTTREALLNDISLRSLDLKQSIALNLVYLAKGYEALTPSPLERGPGGEVFMLACAETALAHDEKNLNALLLKAQVYEQRVMNSEMPAADYEKLLAELYHLGYRQLPDDMRAIILSKIQGTPSTTPPTDKTPNPFESIGEQARYVTLSNGLFEELHTPQKLVRYGRTVFDTEENRVVKFLEEDISTYQVDPVVFALSVDPLTKSYPWYTPYQFAGNNPIRFVDLDGLEQHDPYPNAYLNPKTKVDMTKAPDLFVTKSGRSIRTHIDKGRKWNAAWYWEQVRQQAPEMFDPSNTAAIDNGKSPVANPQYIKHNPSQASFEGMRLEHHHYKQGNEAYALPWKLHRGQGYTKLWHKFGKAMKGVGIVGSFIALAESAKGSPSAAMSGIDPLGVSMAADDMIQDMEDSFTKVALSQSFTSAAKYFEGSGDFGVFYAEEADLLDLLSGKAPSLSSERFRTSGFFATLEAASEQYNSSINYGIIYKKENNGDYNVIGVKPLDEK
jgi:HNH/Endo VII superfamily nuclease toxin with a HHH motif